MIMFWLSVVLAALIGSLALLTPPVGIGLLIVALVLAGNGFVRLQRRTPPKTRINLTATWVALAVSVLGLVRTVLFA
ncbi:MAG: hypothetical protein JO006_13175 [Paucibacter sp.]|nr:hypothetical protein [Roseateles sp.]